MKRLCYLLALLITVNPAVAYTNLSAAEAAEAALVPTVTQPAAPASTPTEREQVFTTLFPGVPYNAAENPYFTNNQVLGPGTYGGLTQYGAIVLVVDQYYASNDPMVTQHFGAQGTMGSFFGDLYSAAGVVDIVGVVSTVEFPGFPAPIYKLHVLGFDPLLALPESSFGGCSTVPANVPPPAIPDDICGPPCDPEAEDDRQELDEHCVDAFRQTYQLNVANLCITYNTEFDKCKDKLGLQVSACMLAVNVGMLACIAGTAWSWIIGGAAFGACMVGVFAAFALCMLDATEDFASCSLDAENDFEGGKAIQRNNFLTSILGCCKPCPPKE